MARPDRPHGGLEGARRRPAHGAPAQRRRRRPGRPGRARRRAARGVRLPARLLPLLGEASSAETTSRYGQFGENFTVDGLPDDEVCIGDRYRIGGALFEVTQPRVTCYRVGIRMDEPRMPALLVSNGRPGFYLRVLQEGEVEAGDEIVKVAAGPERMTVAEIDALLYLPGHVRADLERALRIPALSPGWRGSFQALLDHEDGIAGAPAGNPGLDPARAPAGVAWLPPAPGRAHRPGEQQRGLRRARARRRAAARGGAAGAVRRAAAPARPGCASRAAQLLALRAAEPTSDTASASSASPTAWPARYLRDRARTGDLLEVSAPRGRLHAARGDGPVVLLSAGVGATPVLAMLHALAAEASRREVWWLYGARNGDDHPFREESRGLLRALPGGHSHVRYSRPRPEDRPGSTSTPPDVSPSPRSRSSGFPATRTSTCAARPRSCAT